MRLWIWSLGMGSSGKGYNGRITAIQEHVHGLWEHREGVSHSGDHREGAQRK